MGYRAFDRCLALAFIYPVVAIVIAWVIANAHSPGGLQLFADIPGWGARLWRALLIVAVGVAVGVAIRNIDHFAAKINELLRRLWPALTRPDGFLSKASGLVSFAVAGVGAVAVAGVGVVVVVGVVVGSTEGAALVLFFFLLLPLCNAVSDFLSVAATRGFLGWVTGNRSGLPAILSLLFFDLVLGVIFLALLLILLTNALDLWAFWLPDSLPLDWRAYLQTARGDPWQGIALWMMVATTLLPTMVHLSFGAGAALTHGFRLNAGTIRRRSHRYSQAYDPRRCLWCLARVNLGFGVWLSDPAGLAVRCRFCAAVIPVTT